MNKRKIYDFDEFSLFLLNLLLNLDEKSFIRLSSGGFGVHVETNIDLSLFEDQNRRRWSEKYGYTITFNQKRILKGRKVSTISVDKWKNVQTFINTDENLINKCINHAKKKRKEIRRGKSAIKKQISFKKSRRESKKKAYRRRLQTNLGVFV